MKNILLLTATIISLGFLNSTFAQQGGITFGVQNTDVDIDGGSPDAGVGFFVGWVGKFEMGGGGHIRSGAILSQRKFSNEILGEDAEATMLSIDVPVNYLHMFSESAAVFGGLKLGLNVSDDCDYPSASCETNAESLHFGLNGGGTFMMTPDFSIDVDLVIGMSDIAEDVEWKNSIGVGVTYNYY